MADEDTTGFAVDRIRGACRAQERIRQLNEEKPQLMRKSRKSASGTAGEGGGRLLLHLGSGLRRRARGDDWELTLDPPVNAVLPVSRSALAALAAAFGE